MYKLEQVKEATLRYFKGDELATDKWIQKYCLKDNKGNYLELTPDDMHHRLAKEFSRIENKYRNPLSEETIYNILRHFKYIIPQGSPMYGIGNNESTTSLSNCFVIGNNNSSDSYGSIMRTDEEQIHLMKRRGGVGHDMSHLRPAGALANNAILGDLAGLSLYMERYSNSTREVAQDGRRGALMLSIHVNHPDTGRFISAKLEKGKVTGANISVKLTDEFMKAVKEDKDFYQTFPIDLKTGNIEEFNLPYNELRKYWDTVGNKGYIKKIKARELWDDIIKNAWSSAEPGVLFWDKIISESPADCYGTDWETVSTNPCFTGDTIVAVADGRNGVTIKELSENGSKFIVYSARKNKSSGNRGGGWKTEIKEAIAFKTGNKEIIEIILSDGSSFKCTPEHLLATPNGNYIEAKFSEGLELAKFYSFSCKNSGKSYRHINSKTNGYSKQYRMIWEYYNGIYDGKLFDIDHKDCDSTNDFIYNLRKLSKDEHKKETLRFGLNNPINKIIGTERHRLMNKRKNILANSSKYFWSKERELEELNKFDEKFGYILEKLEPVDLNVYFDKRIYVEKINYLGIEDVYDLNVEDNNNFYIITKTDDEKFLNSSGVLVHNCGEIPLCPYDSCRLLAMNLYSYVVEPFTKKARFDFLKFSQHVSIAQRLMDDLVDLEIEKLDRIISKIENDPEPVDIKKVELNVWNKIRDKAVLGRRTGLGITAEGDMVAALGMRYGSDASIIFCEKVHKELAVCSYSSSIILAKERGSFPIFDRTKEADNPFIKRILNEMFKCYSYFYNDYFRFGRRNISNLTIAPTGTTSLMSQTTSGVEPVFQTFYKRRTKVTDKSKATFTDEVGDFWNEYFVIHPKFKEWYDINWYKLDSKLFDIDFHKPIEDYDEEGLNGLFEKSPYYLSTANDINWVESIKLQGAVQKWIDHSISKTVNIPKETTVETVSEIYLTAWEEGCKGVTIYRDGCRTGVLVSNNEKNKENIFDYNNSFPRPKVVECDIYHKTALKQDWMILVGKINGKPYEIFVLKDLDNFIFPEKIERGKVIKVKRKHYSLEGILNGKLYSIDNIIDLMSEDERVNTRKYSIMLRHGIHPKFIVREIKKSSSVVSFDKVVQRVLENYVEEDEKEHCPNCGGENYYSHEGCWSCLDCGYSKCG